MAAKAKRKKIAIACQGGGSQTAFTSGALKGLADGGVSEHFQVVSLSGTSGGALCDEKQAAAFLAARIAAQ